MKPIPFALGLMALLAAQIPAIAQKTEPSLVTTTGQAEIKVVPDLADLRFDVEIRNVELPVARRQHAERMKKLLSVIRSAGVAETDLQTSQIQITPFYQREEATRAETEVIQFYSVTQTVAFTLTEIKKVPDVTASAIGAGATRVGEAKLRTSQLRKFKDQARTLAVRAAKEKAIALANDLGSKVGKPHTITEHPSHEFPFAMGNNLQLSMGAGGGAADAGSGSFEPGTISIRADIQVAFLLE